MLTGGKGYVWDMISLEISFYDLSSGGKRKVVDLHGKRCILKEAVQVDSIQFDSKSSVLFTSN